MRANLLFRFLLPATFALAIPQAAHAVWLCLPAQAQATAQLTRIELVTAASGGQSGLFIQPTISINGDAASVRQIVMVVPVSGPARDAWQSDPRSFAALAPFTRPVFYGPQAVPVTEEQDRLGLREDHPRYGQWFFIRIPGMGNKAIGQLLEELKKLECQPPADEALARHAKADGSFVICIYRVWLEVQVPEAFTAWPVSIVAPGLLPALPLGFAGDQPAVVAYGIGVRPFRLEWLEQAGLQRTEDDKSLLPEDARNPLPARQANRITGYAQMPAAAQIILDEWTRSQPDMDALRTENLHLYRVYGDALKPGLAPLVVLE